MLYILYNHYEYYPKNPDTVLILESDKTKKEIVEIYSSLRFLLEILMGNNSPSINMQCLQSILVDYYGMTNEKDKIEPSSYEDIEMFEFNLPEEQKVEQKDGVFRNVCIIELFGARRYYCRDDYREIIDRWLPKGKQLEKLKNKLCLDGTDVLKKYYPDIEIINQPEEDVIEKELDSTDKEMIYRPVPRDYLNKEVIKTVQKQLERFSKYLDEIHFCLMENEDIVETGMDPSDEEFFYIKDVDMQVRKLENSLKNLYDYSFYHEHYEGAAREIRKQDMDWETEQLIIMHPKCELKDALCREYDGKDIYAAYTEEQIRKALKNYDMPEYEKLRQEFRANGNEGTFLKLSVPVKYYGNAEDIELLEERIKSGLEYYGMDVNGEVKIKNINDHC